jgi:hypothetical protein
LNCKRNPIAKNDKLKNNINRFTQFYFANGEY